MQLGPAEILVVLVIALLVFGPNKLPEVGRQVGRAMKEFRQFQQTMTRDVHEVFADATKSAEPAPTLPPKATEVIDAESSEVAGHDAAVSEIPVSGLTPPVDPRPDSGGDPEASA